MHYPRLFLSQATGASIGMLVLGTCLAGTDAATAVQHEMRMMDTDRNGTISAAEHAEGARQMFATMDANRDGTVTAAEMDAAHAAVTGQQAKQGELSSARKIGVIDTDKDGQLSAGEHLAGSKRMFTNMDTDQDGRLTDQELLAGRERLLGNKKY
jgi:Ca2+-binding EF-hand superfamily protein